MRVQAQPRTFDDCFLLALAVLVRGVGLGYAALDKREFWRADVTRIAIILEDLKKQGISQAGFAAEVGYPEANVSVIPQLTFC